MASTRRTGRRPGAGRVLPGVGRHREGVDALVDAVVDRMPEGPRYYPEGMVTDVAEAFWVADLVREELLHRVDDELPHSIACRVTEWEWPRVRCEILVERDSQKGIVIGKGGEHAEGGGHRGAPARCRRAPTSSSSCGSRSAGSTGRTPSTGSASDPQRRHPARRPALSGQAASERSPARIVPGHESSVADRLPQVAEAERRGPPLHEQLRSSTGRPT